MRGVLIPMYGEFPVLTDGGLDPAGAWGQLLAACREFSGRLEIRVIANPMSGPGVNIDGTIPNPWVGRVYRTAIVELQYAGATVLGYVPTGWMARGGQSVTTHWDDKGRPLQRASTRAGIVAACQAHMANWHAAYEVDGIFLDEVAVQSRGGRADGNAALARHAEVLAGGAPLVFNYGVTPEGTLTGAPESWSFCTLENRATEFMASREPMRPSGQAAALLHHAPELGSPAFGKMLQLARARGAAWIFPLNKADWHYAPDPGWFRGVFKAIAEFR